MPRKEGELGTTPGSRSRSRSKHSEHFLVALSAASSQGAAVNTWEKLQHLLPAVDERHRKCFTISGSEHNKLEQGKIQLHELEHFAAASAWAFGVTPQSNGTASAERSTTGAGSSLLPSPSALTYASSYELYAGETKRKSKKSSALLSAKGRACFAVSTYGTGYKNGVNRTSLVPAIFQYHTEAAALYEGGSGHRFRGFETSKETRLSC